MLRQPLWPLVVLPTLLAGAGVQRPDDPVETEVRKVLNTQVQAWNRGDLDGFVAWYWNSPEVVFQSGGSQVKGWEAMRDRYIKRYKADGKEMGALDFRDLDVIVLGPEAALARGRWRLKMKDGSTPGGLFTVIFRKLPEGWRIIHDHTSSDEQPTGAASERKP